MLRPEDDGVPTRLLTTICALAATAALATACSSGAAPAGGTAAAPDLDATLRIGYAGPTQSLDPVK